MPKAAHSTVDYEHPAKGMNHCSQCKHFITKPISCEIVKDPIKAVDWCKRFKLRKSKK